MTAPAPIPLPASARAVLVTGAGKRLGRAIALALAQAGWWVAVHHASSEQDARQTAAECAAFSGGSARFRCDLSDTEAVRALVPRVLAQWGRLDAVVNSAAIFEHDAPATFDAALLSRHLAVNTAAPLLLAQALHAHWLARPPQEGHPRHGVVVNLLDQKLWNPNPDFFSYTLTKAALQSATVLMAQGLAPQLRVVGVAPGLTLDTPQLSPERFAALHALSPLGHSSSPADVAAAVRFALENESLTGTALLVDGGQHLMRFERDFSMMTP